MARYIHPDVRDAGDSEETPVTLVVVPVEGHTDRVKAAARERGGTAEEKSLGMLKVELPSRELESFAGLECIDSISFDDITIGDLDEGNLKPRLE